jgi:hypothetical protein
MDGLTVSIPPAGSFYSLYADGVFSRKISVKTSGETLLTYPGGAVVFLFYTYPSHREACVIRNDIRAGKSGGKRLPGLSKNVSLLFGVRASGTDKLRRAIAFLNTNSGGAYSRTDAFYTRLYFLIRQRGKLNYAALRRLAEAPAGL